MNAFPRELFRQNLLVQLDQVAPAHLRIATLRVGAMAGGFDVDDKAVDAELAYLADKGFTAAANKALSPENKHWRITASGRDYVAEQGLT